jgi:hypothetical protein
MSTSASTNEEHTMKVINLLTLVLVIVGGLNWGLVGLLNFDLVAAIFGAGSALLRLIYTRLVSRNIEVTGVAQRLAAAA